jgi:CheY-like chemotaxis protein
VSAAVAASNGAQRAEYLPTVLIVEDDVLVRAAAAKYLRGTGFTVLEAVDVDQALALLRAEPVQLVFADVKLPGTRNGLDLMRMLPTEFPGVKGLLTSGVVSADELPLGEITLLKKPYFLFELERHLRRLLG